MAKKVPFIEMSGVSDTLKKYEKFVETSPAVFDRTLKDMGSRAPAQVASAVTSVYGIKKGDITYKKGYSKTAAGNIFTNGETLSTFELVYSGRVLTPLHFGMTPKVKPDKKKYKVKAKIKKSAKVFKAPTGGSVFLAPAGNNGTIIPWFRNSSLRTDIEPIKTISLPQMVDNEAVRELMREKLNEILYKRWNHNIEQHMNKIFK